VLYYLGGKAARRDAVKMGLVGALGIISIFFVFGFVIACLGLFLSHISLITKASGLILIAMGLVTLLDAHLPTPNLPIVFSRRKGPIGMFLFGAAYGLASMGCSLAIFLSVVAYAISTQGFLSGFLSIIFYSLGIGIPMVLVSVMSSSIKELVSRRCAKAARWIRKLSGLALLIVGFSLLIRAA
jgi:cytochrome c biogenesis protein CcdA